MIIGVTGASGFIGRAFGRAAARKGWAIRPLGRTVAASDIEGCDAIVHLAGETVDGRWTKKKKAEIERSRVEGTRMLVAAIASAQNKPRVLVSASGAGYYGNRGDEVLDESSGAGDDFLAHVCRGWEAEAAAAAASGVRVVLLRTGIVIGSNGGALAKMMRPFAFGAGGPLGNGKQFVPWIHIDDIVALYAFAIENEQLRGAVNAVTPDYATSARFSQAIGAAMRRPSLAPAPGFALKIVLGEFAGTVLASQLVLPLAAQRAGFVWSHPRLEEALQSIIEPKRSTKLLRAYSSRQFVPAPLDEVFAFFSDAKNLEAITPPSLRFAIEEAPDPVCEGSTISYRLSLHGLPVKWKTLITRWRPKTSFADVQLRGPYALWEHVHGFREVTGGVEISDDVTYVLPFAPLGNLAAGFVRRDVEKIFAHRSEVIARRFGS